jgi:hypothetical protein
MKIIELKDYATYEGINYSTLSKMSADPRLIDPEYIKKKPTDSMDLGSLVDCLLLTPSEFDSIFHYSSVEKPGDRMGELLDNYLASGGVAVTSIEELDLKFLAQCRENIGGYRGKWGIDAVAKEFATDCIPYFKDLAASDGKRIIAPTMKKDTEDAITLIQTCDQWDLPNIFAGPGVRTVSKVPNCEINYQVPIIWNYTIAPSKKTYVMKSLLDIMIVNPDNGNVDILDLKVVGDNPRDFYKKWLTWNYHLQASMYTAAVRSLMFAKGKSIGKITFSFIVASTKYPPIKWRVTEGQIAMGEMGAQLFSGTRVQGFKELIIQYDFHRSTGNYIYSPTEIADNNYFAVRTV